MSTTETEHDGQVRAAGAPPADEPVITVTRDPAVASGMGVLVRVSNPRYSFHTVDWGQDPPLGTADIYGNNRNTAGTTYTKAGRWRITATDEETDTHPVGEAWVTVPLPVPPLPVLTATFDPDDPTGMTVLVTVDNHGHGEVVIDWGQSSPLPPRVINPGDGTTVSRLVYDDYGPHTITAAGVFDPDRSVQVPVLLPAPEHRPPPGVYPRFTSRTDVFNMSCRVDNRYYGPVTIDWGQTDPALPTAANPGDNQEATPVTYTKPGTWTITVRSDNSPQTPPARFPVTVPYPGAQLPSPTVRTRTDPADPTGLTVIVTAVTTRRVAAVVDWGDTVRPVAQEPLSVTDGVAPVRHRYFAPGRYTVRVYPIDEPNYPGLGFITVGTTAEEAS